MTTISQIMTGYREEMEEAQRNVGEILGALVAERAVKSLITGGTMEDGQSEELKRAVEVFELRAKEYHNALHRLLTLANTTTESPGTVQ